MPRKKSYITVTDQFCGAGGSSQGVRRVSNRIKGVEVKLALNHWKLAIETHNTNFPDTIHDCTDISACDPRRYPSTDILITSPECTNHSLAKGVKIVKKQMDLFDSGKIDPAAERSRATMWDVCRFAEYHSYNIIIVENVVDARKWVMFDAWINAMHLLGYNHKCVYLNSMHCHPTPQSRDRMYVVFWKKGNKAPKLEYTPSAWCPKCVSDVPSVQTWKNKQNQYGKYRQQYVYCCPECSTIVEPYYYASFNCIDWSDIGTRIGNKKLKQYYDKKTGAVLSFKGETMLPLSPNTLERIDFGLKKYNHSPFQVINYSPGYSKSILDSTGTLTTNDHHAIVNPPFIVNDQHSTGIDFRVNGINGKIPTITTTHQLKLVTPFIIKGEHSANLKNAQSTLGAFQTQTTRQSMALCTPFIINHHHSSKTNSLSGAAPAQTTHEKYGLLTPFVVEMNKTGECKPASEPTATFTSGGINHALCAAPFTVTARKNSMAHAITDAMTTQSQMINHGIVSNEAWNSFISYYYGTHQASHISDALGSATTKDRHQLISYQTPSIEDCYYRMLFPHEVKLAMAFDHNYIVLGSGKNQVKQLGNAVTPPAMEWLVERCIESLN